MKQRLRVHGQVGPMASRCYRPAEERSDPLNQVEPQPRRQNGHFIQDGKSCRLAMQRVLGHWGGARSKRYHPDASRRFLFSPQSLQSSEMASTSLNQGPLGSDGSSQQL